MRLQNVGPEARSKAGMTFKPQFIALGLPSVAMQNLNDILKWVWPNVRARHFYPELPPPRIAEGKERVALEMKGKKISLSMAFINEMSHFMEPQRILEGLLDHAISHHIYCPWDFSTHLMLYKEAKSVIQDKNTAKKAAGCFMDVVADTHCISRKETPLPEIYRHFHRGRLDEVICALYQKIWGLDLGAEKFEKIAARLSRIPYLDRSLWPDSIRRFASVIQEVLDEEAMDEEMQNPSSMGDHNLGQYSPQEIEQGLKKLASEAATPGEFNSILQDIQDDLQDSLGKKGQGIGLGKGDDLEADILYYMKLAQKYALPIRKRPMEKSGSLYPHHHLPWEAGKPVYDIDPWKSFGRLMPGLTKSWQRIEGEIYGHAYGTPDCMVVIDSSASMVDPNKEISHAVLGAGCAADAYLRNEARVAVYNFSDAAAGDELILPYTRNRRKLYGALCRYFGGGTRLFVKHIQALQTEQLPDIFLITDMQITNLEILVQYLNECKNRITAVHIGKNKHIDAFQQKMASRHHVHIHCVENVQDIPRIVLGSVREFLFSR
jgi:hypothetical protein